VKKSSQIIPVCVCSLLLFSCNARESSRFTPLPPVLTASQYSSSEVVLIGRVRSINTAKGEYGQEFLVADVSVDAFIKGDGRGSEKVVVNTNLSHFQFDCCLEGQRYLMYLKRNEKLGYFAPTSGKGDFVLIHD